MKSNWKSNRSSLMTVVPRVGTWVEMEVLTNPRGKTQSRPPRGDVG